MENYLRYHTQDDDSGLRIRREPAGNSAFSGQFLQVPVPFPQETAGKTSGKWTQYSGRKSQTGSFHIRTNPLPGITLEKDRIPAVIH